MSVAPGDGELTKKKPAEELGKHVEDAKERAARHTAENALFEQGIQKSVESIQDPKEREKEALELRKTYHYVIGKGRIQSRKDYNRSVRSEKAEKAKLEKRNKELTALEKLPIDSKNRDKKITQKKEQIAVLGISIRCHARQIEDAKTHYDLFDKINTKASKDPTPQTIHSLKNQTIRINNAIKKQRKLLKTLKKNEKASAKAFLLLSEKEQKLAKEILAKSPEEGIKDIQNIGNKKVRGNVLAYVQHERRKKDSETDYAFSRKIFENAVKNAGESADATKELTEQFASLNAAITERDGYREELEAAENRKLKNFNAQVLLAGKIAKITEDSRKKGSKNEGTKIAALDENLKALQLEDKQQARQINDAHRLHAFSSKLIEEAAKEGNAKQLVQQLKDLKVAADRQKRYRDRLETVEKKILAANAKNPTKDSDKERHDLIKTQLEREKDDATLAHAMMTELIDNAYKDGKKPDSSVLPKQCAQLREGIGGRRKYTRRPFGQTKNRLALDSAENKHLDIKIKQEKNQTLLDGISSEDITKIKELTVEKAKLSLEQKQTARRAGNATQDHDIGRAFLEKAKKDKTPENLPEQFKLMEVTIADRDVLTKQLEKEETRQLKKKNEIEKAKFGVIEHKKDLNTEKQKLEKIKNEKGEKSPEFIAQQSAVYASQSKLQRQEWELKKLERRQAENATFDERRLKNAEENEKKANELLAKILDPDASPEVIAETKKELETLKKNIKEEKKLEKRLAPPARVKERAQYRANLEKAEEKRLEYNKKLNLHAIEWLKADPIIDITDRDAAFKNTMDRDIAFKKLKEESERLKVIEAQIKREEDDTKLIYEFSAKLLQASIDDIGGKKAEKLESQFKALKTVDKIQKNLRDRIKAVDEKLNSPLYLSLNLRTKEQLQRQKNDLIFGHTETQKLTQAAFNKKPPDPKGLAKDCKNLREGIGGTRKYTGRSFGQERNREALDKYENLDSKNEKKLQESNIRLTSADAVKNEHPNRHKKALENYEDCTLLKEQSARRLLDAKNDYEMGEKLLKRALDEPKDTSKSKRLENLKQEFAVLKAAITERNKLVTRLEKIEKNARKTERKDAKNIKKAENKKGSLEKNLKKAQEKFKKLEAANPQDLKAIDEQNARIEKFQGKLVNQRDKIKYLTEQASENKTRNDTLVESAKQSCIDANRSIALVSGSTDEKAAITAKNAQASTLDPTLTSTAAQTQTQAPAPTPAPILTQTLSPPTLEPTLDPARATTPSPTPDKPRLDPTLPPTVTPDSTRDGQQMPEPNPAPAPAPNLAQVQGTVSASASAQAPAPAPNQAPAPAPTPKPAPPNSVTFPVGTNLKKGARALEKNMDYRMRADGKGGFQLVSRYDGSLVATITPNENGTMTATLPHATDKFNATHMLTLRTGIIKAIATFSTNSQGMGFDAASKMGSVTSNFKDNDANELTQRTFNEQYTRASPNWKGMATVEATAPAPTPTPAPVPVPVPAHPTPENSITVSVNTSEIAQAQAAHRAKEQTGYEIRAKGQGTGEFELFLGDSKMPVGDIKFKVDQNGQGTMTATFKEPVERLAISAIQIFAAGAQPNDVVIHPKHPFGLTCNFKGKEIEEFAKTTFSKPYETVRDENYTTMKGEAASQEKTAIENGKRRVSEPPQPSPPTSPEPNEAATRQRRLTA